MGQHRFIASAAAPSSTTTVSKTPFEIADKRNMGYPSGQAAVVRLSARRFVGRLRGGSQSALVDTGHGYYVVKWRENPQHRRILINEAVCSQLLQRLAVSSPPWACIHADSDFIEGNPQIRIHGKYGHVTIEPGWHFGSRFPVDPHHELVYISLPPKLIGKVSNWRDFLKVYVFDVWVDNQDGRQAVFFRPPKRGLRVEMIDHGHALGFDGVEWRFNSSPVRRRFPGASEIYARSESAQYYKRAIAAIQQVTRNDLMQLLDLLPPAWIDHDHVLLSRHFDRLLDRSRRLDEMVVESLAALSCVKGCEKEFSRASPDLLDSVSLRCLPFGSIRENFPGIRH